MEKSLSYQDVYLTPKYSELRSRSEADISVEFLGKKLTAPWCPSNMLSVIDEKIAHWLSENDYPYFMHRFGDNKTFIAMANTANWKLISISVGVKQIDKELIQWIRDSNMRVDWICVDIAHGHSILMKEMIQFIRDTLSLHSFRPKIIAGNVATPEAVNDLTKWGADAAKVGIGPSSVCTTKDQTGFHIPMFSCVKKCHDMDGLLVNNEMGGIDNFMNPSIIPIIADGGCRQAGDFAKALVAGATLIMAGGIFAGCIDAPGEPIYWSTTAQGHLSKNIKAKKFHGSASSKQKGSNSYVEGIEIEIPCNGLTYESKYQELTESLKSAISYAGGRDLMAFKSVQYISQ